MNVKPPSTVREGDASHASMRLGLGVLALALLWIGVFWLTPARPKEQVPLDLTFDDPPAGATPDDVAPDPLVDELATGEQTGAPDPAAERAGAPAQGVIPPETEAYVVQKGDTAASISQRFYGTEEYWRRVMKANPRVDFTRLREGQVIRVAKDPMNIQGLPADGQSSVVPEPAFSEYIVRRNDTLTGIAKEIYGRASLWTRIRDANPGKINAQGTNIRPGMTLLIPPPPPAR